MSNQFNNINLNEYKPLRDIVFETLRNAILSGQLKPNERLMEIQLAEKLGVSRTPVREAIRKLELEGLVNMLPRKGAYVSDVSLKEIIDAIEVREALEVLAITSAIKNITSEDIEALEKSQQGFIEAYKNKNIEETILYDTEIHKKINHLSYNNKLISIMDGLNETLSRFRMIFFNEYKDTSNIIKQHEEIILAIKEKNTDKAVKSTKKHLNSIKNDMKKFMVSNH